MSQQLTVSEKLSRLDSVATSRQLNELIYGKAKASMLEQVRLGEMITEIRELLTDDVMEKIGGLQGTEVGFRTDRDHTNKVYSIDELREPTLTAILRGFRCVDNEFNVIGGRFYAALNGLERKVREYPGLMDLNITPGVPKKNSKTPDVATVPVIATYLLNGEMVENRWEGDRSLVVRMNKGMIGAAAAGKATRQALLRIWKSLGNRTEGFGEDASDGPDGAVVDAIEEQGLDAAHQRGNPALMANDPDPNKSRHTPPGQRELNMTGDGNQP